MNIREIFSKYLQFSRTEIQIRLSSLQWNILYVAMISIDFDILYPYCRYRRFTGTFNTRLFLSYIHRDCMCVCVFTSHCVFVHRSELECRLTRTCNHKTNFHKNTRFCILILIWFLSFDFISFFWIFRFFIANIFLHQLTTHLQNRFERRKNKKCFGVSCSRIYNLMNTRVFFYFLVEILKALIVIVQTFSTE